MGAASATVVGELGVVLGVEQRLAASARRWTRRNSRVEAGSPCASSWCSARSSRPRTWCSSFLMIIIGCASVGRGMNHRIDIEGGSHHCRRQCSSAVPEFARSDGAWLRLHQAHARKIEIGAGHRACQRRRPGDAATAAARARWAAPSVRLGRREGDARKPSQSTGVSARQHYVRQVDHETGWGQAVIQRVSVQMEARQCIGAERGYRELPVLSPCGYRPRSTVPATARSENVI